MKKLNIITGTAIYYGLEANAKPLALLFKAMEDSGLPFKGESLGASIIEAKKTKETLGFEEDAIYNYYENYILPIRNSKQLEFLKKENISYNVLNIKDNTNNEPLKIQSYLNESADIAKRQGIEFAKKQASSLEEDYSEVLADSSVFKVFNVSVTDLDNRLSEIISFFKN